MPPGFCGSVDSSASPSRRRARWPARRYALSARKSRRADRQAHPQDPTSAACLRSASRFNSRRQEVTNSLAELDGQTNMPSFASTVLRRSLASAPQRHRPPLRPAPSPARDDGGQSLAADRQLRHDTVAGVGDGSPDCPDCGAIASQGHGQGCRALPPAPQASRARRPSATAFLGACSGEAVAALVTLAS
jgi:hypothetical protein